ncbi:MAG: hypothetical protein FJ041_02870, partial [Candidatus Cloacimonetes bacterium]|nr:hypothetical protein [Candidatus Cloacimonadota bacterium]
IIVNLGLMSLSAIDYISGSGENVFTEMSSGRFRDFYYHNNTVDQLWYGTNKWAVKFDFTAVYPTYPNTGFRFKKAKVFFPIKPQTSNSVSMEVRANTNNLPGVILSTTTMGASIDTTDVWIDFNLPDSLTVNSVWLVLNCNTGVNGPYIAASIGGGTYSYYWNTNTPVAYFQNMALAGINSEFLFSVSGRFETSAIDVELYSFDFSPLPALWLEVKPEFTIYNNSNTTIVNPRIELSITSPTPEYTFPDTTIYINRTLLPYSALIVTATDPIVAEHNYWMPETPMQLKARAKLYVQNATVDSLFKHYNLFSDIIPVKLVENFLHSTGIDSLLLGVQNSENNNFTTLNYFPMASNAYYTPGAAQRFSWYGFSGIPMTVLGGDDNIAGFIPSTYSNDFSTAVYALNREGTFLTQSDNITFNLPDPYNLLTARLILRNSYTHLFVSNNEPSLMSQSRFYAALCKKISLFGAERYVFNRWGAYADTINSPINFDSIYLKEFSFPVSDLNGDELEADYAIFYWIQKQSDKQILFSNFKVLSGSIATSDMVAEYSKDKIKLISNPIRQGNKIQFAIPDKYRNTQVRYGIYNIKGQLIDTGSISVKQKDKLELPNNVRSTGVYFIKFDILNKDEANSYSQKIVIF